jgi:hypothetical protein
MYSDQRKTPFQGHQMKIILVAALLSAVASVATAEVDAYEAIVCDSTALMAFIAMNQRQSDIISLEDVLRDKTDIETISIFVRAWKFSVDPVRTARPLIVESFQMIIKTECLTAAQSS